MLNFILKNTEIRAVPEECGTTTQWLESQHVSLRRRLSLSFRLQHKESSLMTACPGGGGSPIYRLYRYVPRNRV